MTRLLGFLSGLLLVIAVAFVVLRYAPAWLPGERGVAGVSSADGAVAAATQEEQARQSTPPPAEEPPAGLPEALPEGLPKGLPEEAGPEPAPNPAEQPARAPTQEPARGSTPETLPRLDDPPPAHAAAVATGAGEDPGDDRAAIAAATAATAADEADESARQWHAFWQPFRSEISAEGFRRRLEGVTGLDYRIVSPRPGEYQVAFAYRDEAERQQNLAAIEEATGLVLRSRVL
ncbi:hypothetical protein [Lentisalinibacter orientalis]|uniref:hypothetical protein n=1 Tax=Lentisalinibacter orientalis TaxID=2992241 RepID=UPI0038669F2D